MLTFNYRYFILTVLLFITEVLIAAYAQDDFIRPYMGDVLVAILVYCFVRTWLNAPVVITALCVLVFCYLIEFSQYFNLVARIGLGKSRLANIVFGNYFTWIDMLCYTVGIALVILAERILLKAKTS